MLAWMIYDHFLQIPSILEQISCKLHLIIPIENRYWYVLKMMNTSQVLGFPIADIKPRWLDRQQNKQSNLSFLKLPRNNLPKTKLENYFTYISTRVERDDCVAYAQSNQIRHCFKKKGHWWNKVVIQGPKHRKATNIMQGWWQGTLPEHNLQYYKRKNFKYKKNEKPKTLENKQLEKLI